MASVDHKSLRNMQLPDGQDQAGNGISDARTTAQEAPAEMPGTAIDCWDSPWSNNYSVTPSTLLRPTVKQEKTKGAIMPSVNARAIAFYFLFRARSVLEGDQSSNSEGPSSPKIPWNRKPTATSSMDHVESHSQTGNKCLLTCRNPHQARVERATSGGSSETRQPGSAAMVQHNPRRFLPHHRRTTQHAPTTRLQNTLA